MRKSEIIDKKFLVGGKGWMVREVVTEASKFIDDPESVLWYNYDLETGEGIWRGMCSLAHLARWADREATPEEIARLDTEGHRRMLSYSAHVKIAAVIEKYSLGTVKEAMDMIAQGA